MCNNRITGCSSDMKLTLRGRLREVERVIDCRIHRKTSVILKKTAKNNKKVRVLRWIVDAKNWKMIGFET